MSILGELEWMVPDKVETRVCFSAGGELLPASSRGKRIALTASALWE